MPIFMRNPYICIANPLFSVTVYYKISKLSVELAKLYKMCYNTKDYGVKEAFFEYR